MNEFLNSGPETSQSSESGQNPILRQTLEALAKPVVNGREFFANFRQVCEELEQKEQRLKEEVHLINFANEQKLHELQSLRHDLISMKDEVITLRDDYMSFANGVISTVEKHAPTLLSKIQEVSDKQNRLNRLKIVDSGRAMLDRCTECMTARDIGNLFLAFCQVHTIKDSLEEYPVEYEKYVESVEEMNDEVTIFVKAALNDTLQRIRYPFEEAIDLRGFRKDVDLLSELLCILYKASEDGSIETGAVTLQNAMFEPLKTRFLFHFYGSLKTNDISKPEWFLTQVLTWMQSALSFFELVIGRVNDKLGTTISSRQFFVHTLTELAVKKVKSMLQDDRVVLDNAVFSHLLDECVLYEENRQARDRESFGLNILTVFCEQQTLDRWIKLETDGCIGSLDEMLMDDNRWRSRFKDMEDADSYMVCECADMFVGLLHAVQMRARQLPEADAQRRFVDLQLMLVDDFRVRLAQIASQAESPWTEPFPHILNAIWYLAVVIEEWSDACLLRGVLSPGDRGVFDESVKLYRQVWSNMANDAVSSLRAQTIDLAQQYQQQRWMTMEPSMVTKQRELSAAFCPFLMKIRTMFRVAAAVISPVSLPEFFKRMTEATARVVLHDVVDITIFNAEGATQMLYDIESGLIPVLDNVFSGVNCEISAAYTKIMATVVGSLRLLSLKWAPATMLSEEIAKIPEEAAEEKLIEMNIMSVTKERAMKLFTQRKDLSIHEHVGVNLKLK